MSATPANKNNQIGLGTWQMTSVDCERAVSFALQVGYRHIDTAAAYRNEEAMGRAVRSSGLKRDELFITTKLWNSEHSDPEKAFLNSLSRLGVSNFTQAHLQELLRKCYVKPSVNQVEFHPFLFQKELLTFCKSEDILMEAYSPLTRGECLGDPALVAMAKSYVKWMGSTKIVTCVGIQRR